MNFLRIATNFGSLKEFLEFLNQKRNLKTPEQYQASISAQGFGLTR
jgi:hypothetical protein